MEVASKLRELLGDDIVADDPETVSAHSGDKWFAAHEPDAVVFARSTGDVSKLLEFASREKIPVTARGGGFGYVGGCVPASGGARTKIILSARPCEYEGLHDRRKRRHERRRTAVFEIRRYAKLRNRPRSSAGNGEMVPT